MNYQLRTKFNSLILLMLVCTAGLFFGFSRAEAADHYIRQGASGSNNGSDWVNAWTQLPSTLQRGDTYYIADGSYGNYTFDDAESGTEYIYIKKAIESEHGTETGWQSSYGDGQAEFEAVSGTWNIDTGYWEINGQTRTDGTSGHGFRVYASSQNTDAKVVDIDGDYVTIKYSEIESWGYSADDNADAIYSVASNPAWNNNITVSYSWIHNVNRQPFYFYRTSDVLLEYNWVTEHYNEDAYAVHSSCASINYCGLDAGYIIRNNVFRNMEGTTCLGPKDSVQSGFKFYGNIFFNDADHILDGFVNGTQPVVSDFDFSGGVTTDTGGDTTTDVLFFNNTMVDLYGADGVQWESCSGNESRNNLWVNSSSVSVDCTSSNNTIDGATSFFENYANHDYHLAATLAGGVLSFEYSTDIDSVIRGVDGTWDRGAYEYVAGSTSVRSDVDQNGSSTTTDAQLTLRYSLALDMSQTAWYNSATTGDADCSGTTNSTDAMLILRNSLGLDMSATAWCGGG